MKRGLGVSLVWLALGFAAGACEKQQASPSGSGALTATELQLFHFLPNGKPIYFSGDYSKVENFMKGGLGHFTATIGDKIMPGMTSLMTCLSQPAGMKVAASVSVANNTMDMQMVISGLQLADVARCSQTAGIKTVADADHRFISLDLPTSMPSGDFVLTYYALPNGWLYHHQTQALGAKPTVHCATRPEAEADIAALARGTAADDPAFTKLAAKVDRTKTGWFVGSGAGTPLAETIGDAYGSIDASSGLSFDMTLQLKKSTDADKLEEGVAQLRKMSDQLPGNFKDVVKALKVDRSGDRIHIALALDDAQLKSVTDQLGDMIGQRLGQR